MSVAKLNLDQTLPNEDAFRAQNTAAIIRWLTTADARTLDAINRVLGDIGWRSQLLEAKINEIIDAVGTGVSHPGTVDLSAYARVDGTVPFSAPISGVEGSGGANLTTRAGAAAIASALIAGLAATVDDVSNRVTTLEDAPVIRYSNWVEHTWTTGVKHFLNLTLTSAIVNLDRVLSINITEKLDTSVPTIMVPSPTPIWRYRPAVVGSGRGALIDDAWVVDATTVRMLLPSTSAYASGYGTDATYDIPGARQRFYRATVLEHQ